MLSGGRQLTNLHTPIWWGGLLTALGVLYCVEFRPGARKENFYSTLAAKTKMQRGWGIRNDNDFINHFTRRKRGKRSRERTKWQRKEK